MPTGSDTFTLTTFMADGIVGAVSEHFLRRYPPVSVYRSGEELAYNDGLAAMSYARDQLAQAAEAENKADVALRQLNRDRLYKGCHRRVRVTIRELLRTHTTAAREDLIFAIVGHVLETEQAMHALYKRRDEELNLDLTCQPGSPGAILKGIELLKIRLATVLDFRAPWTSAAERS